MEECRPEDDAAKDPRRPEGDRAATPANNPAPTRTAAGAPAASIGRSADAGKGNSAPPSWTAAGATDQRGSERADETERVLGGNDCSPSRPLHCKQQQMQQMQQQPPHKEQKREEQRQGGVETVAQQAASLADAVAATSSGEGEQLPVPSGVADGDRAAAPAASAAAAKGSSAGAGPGASARDGAASTCTSAKVVPTSSCNSGITDSGPDAGTGEARQQKSQASSAAAEGAERASQNAAKSSPIPVPPSSGGPSPPGSLNKPESGQKAVAAVTASKATLSAAPAAAVAAAAGTVDDPIRAQRAALVNTYSPHIHATDTSLEAARMRLIRALDQTRYLRAMYSDRIYDRYRINLLPVPSAVEDIVDGIYADPEGTVRVLREESASVKEEKEMEKREGVRLNAAVAEAERGGTVDATGAAETADQLAWYGAGLNTIILPENDADDEMGRPYEFRGPTDPESGQRVAGISAACATAAEALLDRVRRASALRSDRKRRRQSAPGVGGTTAREAHSPLHFFSPTVAGGGLDCAGVRTPRTVSSSGKVKKRAKTSSSSGTHGTGRGRGRTKSQASNASLLTLDPAAETVGSATPTAATSALIAAGVGDNVLIRGRPRHSSQMNRWRHPYPDSEAGKKVATVANALQSSKKPAGLAASVASLLADPKVIMAPADARSRNGLENLKTMEWNAAAKTSAVMGVSSVLGQFCDGSDSGSVLRRSNSTGNSTHGKSTHSLTAIDFLFRTNPSFVPGQKGASPYSPRDGVNLDPVTVFSVIYALGLLTTSVSNERGDKKASPLAHLRGTRKLTETFSALAEDVLNEDAEENLPGVEHLRGGGASDRSDDGSDDEIETKRKEEDSPKVNGERNGKTASPPEQVSENESDTKPRSPPAVQESPGDADGESSSQSTPGPASAQPGLSPSLIPTLSGTAIPPFTQQTILQMQQQQAQGGLGVGSGSVSSMLSSDLRQASLDETYNKSMHAAAAASAGARQDINEYLGNSFHAQRVAAGYALPSDWASISLASANIGLSQQALASLSAHDKAARELLARENAAFVAAHARAQAAVAHHHATSTTPGMAGVNALSQQQASSYMAGGAAAAAAAAGNLGAYAPPTSMAPYAAYAGLSASGLHAPQSSTEATDQSQKKRGGEDEKNGGEEMARPDSSTTDEVAKKATRSPGGAASTDGKMPGSDANEDEKLSDLAKQSRKKGATSVDGEPLHLFGCQSTESAVNGSDNDGGDTNGDDANSDVMADAKAGTGTKPVAEANADGESGEKEERKPSATARMPLSPAVMKLVEGSRFHEAVSVYAKEVRDGKKVKSNVAATAKSKLPLLDYLLAVSDDVPIPKSTIISLLKERMSLFLPKIKGVAGIRSQMEASKEAVAAVITTWLWTQHKATFEKTLSMGGRFDADENRMWLIHATVDVAVQSLMSSPPAAADGKALPSKSLDARAAKLVSAALWKEFCIDDEMDHTLGSLDYVVKYLDNQRVEALKAKVKERTLLATLMSRRTKISEAFSNSYTSAMIRAGEALGHEQLCDIGQDELVHASTLLPYDVFDDDVGAWEDPCRPSSGFVSGLSGEELTRRAHGRAMIQKSMKKLQDRYGIKGGTPSAGPYVDSAQSKSDTGRGTGGGMKSPSLSRTSSGLKRKSSFSSVLDSGSAKSSLFRPSHYSAPLIWDSDDWENLPYGRHCTLNLAVTSRGRPFASSSGSVEERTKKRRRSSADTSNSLTPSPKPTAGTISADIPDDKARFLHCSTGEIQWTHVAEMFEPVALNGQIDSSKRTQPSPSPSAKSNSEMPDDVRTLSASSKGPPIIAPFCHEFDCSVLDEESEDEASFAEEEDLRDEVVLARHQEVLDDMKQKLEHAMRMRQQLQDKQKSRLADCHPSGR